MMFLDRSTPRIGASSELNDSGFDARRASCNTSAGSHTQSRPQYQIDVTHKKLYDDENVPLCCDELLAAAAAAASLYVP